MKNLENHIIKLQHTPFQLLPPSLNIVHWQFKPSYEIMLTDLHYAKALQNPRLVDDKELWANINSQPGLNEEFVKLATPMEDFAKLFNKFHLFYFKLLSSAKV